MPTYEYACDDCGFHFEEFQSITAEPLTKCPKCDGKVRRLIGTGNGFLFKGRGFYITDYRSENYIKEKNKHEKKPEKKDKGSASDSTAKKEKPTTVT